MRIEEVAKREALPLGHSDHHTIGVQDTFQIFHLSQDDWMVSDIQNRENLLVKHALKVYHFNP